MACWDGSVVGTVILAKGGGSGIIRLVDRSFVPVPNKRYDWDMAPAPSLSTVSVVNCLRYL